MEISRTSMRFLASGLVALVGLAFLNAEPAAATPTTSKEHSDIEPVPVSDFYEALTATSAERATSLLERVTREDWVNCAANDLCQTRSETLQRWIQRRSTVPDMQWTEKERIATASAIVVRGEVSGTPAATFLGVQPNGRHFSIMTIDIHEVRGGKILRTHHLEDWASAARQLSSGSL